MTLSAGAFYEMIEFQDVERFNLPAEDDFLESFGANASLSTRLNSTLLIRLDADYLESRGRDDEMRLEAGPTVIWKYGLTDVEIGGYYAIYELEDIEGTTTYLDFSVRRRF